MRPSFEIQGVRVGAGHPCYVIAEAGNNHLGQLEVALELIDVAAQAGVNAVKFQTFEARRLYPPSAGAPDFLEDNRSIFEALHTLETPLAWLPELRRAARSYGMALLSTPFHEEGVELLDPHVDAFKIASFDIDHAPLLKAAARRGKPIILSTGAATVDEIAHALEILSEAGAENVALMQCTAGYPAPMDSLNLAVIPALRERFGLPVGLSDHSREPHVAPAVAVAFGAALLEKHFTLSHHLPGPDHPFALEPVELLDMLRTVRAAEHALGHGRKEVLPCEEQLRRFARRSIITTQPLRAGDAFTRENVAVLRHGKLEPGLAPDALCRVLRAVSTRDLPADTVLAESDLDGWREGCP